MSVPLAKVKSVCTAAELAVVEASRRPRLGALSLKETQRYAERARKLRDKWRDQSRRQARGQRRTTGAADLASRSHLKEGIFADALASFEAAAKKLAARSGAPSKSAVKKPAGAKRKPAAAKRSAAKKPAAKKAAPRRKSIAARESAAIMAGLAKKLNVAEHAEPQLPPAAQGASQGNLATTPAQQLAAETAVKENILEQAGVKSRIRGHVSSRVRRQQRRRDVHNA